MSLQVHAEAPRTDALIFGMDGTMIDAMPWHARSWVGLTGRYGSYNEFINTNFLGKLHAATA